MSMPEPPAPRDGWRGQTSPWIFGIRTRIFLSMALLAALLLLALAVGIERQARRELEQELTNRLHAVGEAAVSLIGPGVVPALVTLNPAQGSFPFYRDRRNVLLQLRDRTGVRRIFLADTSGRSIVDTDPRVPLGTPLPQLRSDRLEMREVRRGHPAAAALFTDEQGQYRKTGYVPVMVEGRAIALIGVEADAAFLKAVRTLRGRIMAIGASGIALAFILAAAVARGLTRPLRQLVSWARQLATGDLSRSVPVAGRDEISFLGTTLEQMRATLEVRDREQRTMVAGVAHEIRNPLGGIRLYAELLASDPTLGGPSRARLEKILKELDHMGAIVDEFLLYARPVSPVPQEIDPLAVVRELVDWIRPQADARRVRLEVTEGAGAGEGRLRADPTQLRQILRNLIQNAVDASPPDGLVRVRLEEAARGLRIAVEDQGPGIEAAVRERVFEPFFTTKPDGAGLGLPIVRRLALLNRAQVEVDSAPAGGARFTLLFPGMSGPDVG